MPIQFPSLAWNIVHSDTAQQTATAQQAQIQGANQLAQVQTQDQAILRTTTQMAEPQHTAEARQVSGQTRGARSFMRQRRQKKTQPPEEQFKSAPDPHGRGKLLDIEI